MDLTEFLDMVAPTVSDPCAEPGGCTEYADHQCLDSVSRCDEHCACEELCTCGASLADGEGYDGYCGNCADRLERAKRWS